MKLLKGLFGLVLSLAITAALGQFAPRAGAYVDVLALPVVGYALRGSQRGAMLAGLAAGWLEDAWFRTGLFGLAGFNKTLLGWTLGGLGARLDLNNLLAWFLGTALFTAADRLLEFGLMKLLSLAVVVPDPLELASRAVATGLLAVVVFAILGGGREVDPSRRPSRRRT